MSQRGATGSTRDHLLDTGIAMWASTPVAELYGGYSVSAVAKAAGVTRATFYSYWPSTDAYLDDLLEHLVSVAPVGFDPDVADAVNRLTIVGSDVVTNFLAGADRQLRHLVEDPALYVRYGFLARLDDPVVRERLRAQYRRIDEDRIEVFRGVTTRWGRKPRPPLSWEQYTRIYTMVIETAALHHRLDPETLPAEIYGFVAMALTLVLTARIGDDRPIAEIAEPLNSFPAAGLRMREQAATSSSLVPPPVLRDADAIARAVIEASERLVGEGAWTELTLTAVAMAADTTERTVLNLFGSKPGLAAALFTERYVARAAQIEQTDDPLHDLRAHLALSAEELRRAPALTQSVLLVFAGAATGPAPGVLRGDPMAGIVDNVQRAQDAGLLDGSIDARSVSEMLRRTLLTQVAPLPAAMDPRADAVEVLLRGLQTGTEPSRTPDPGTTKAPTDP